MGSWDHVTLTKEIFNFPQKFKLKNNEIEEIFKDLIVARADEIEQVKNAYFPNGFYQELEGFSNHDSDSNDFLYYFFANVDLDEYEDDKDIKELTALVFIGLIDVKSKILGENLTKENMKQLIQSLKSINDYLNAEFGINLVQEIRDYLTNQETFFIDVEQIIEQMEHRTIYQEPERIHNSALHSIPYSPLILFSIINYH